jgi:predicted amidohydrolase
MSNRQAKTLVLMSSTITNHHDNPPAYETEILSSLSCVRAFETETVWIMCNAGGSASEGYIGGSGVWMPLKGKLAGVKGVEAGLEVVDVDLNVLKVSLEREQS